jgi:tetratricopeptide (TPR) repeat protein
MDDLLERYEAYGDEGVYVEARRLYEQALEAGRDDARLLTNFGYLQECHGRLSIRAAVECYERAIEADPQYDKPNWQLIAALAELGQADQAVARYRQRLAEAPADLRWYRFLASAYMHAGDYEHAAEIIVAGLNLSPGDPSLTEQEGDVFAATGHPGEALERWRRAFAADPENLSSRYSSAFLLEKQGRLAEAAAEWRFIVDWCEDHGYAITADWPRRELQRLEAGAADADRTDRGPGASG